MVNLCYTNFISIKNSYFENNVIHHNKKLENKKVIILVDTETVIDKK